MNGIRIPQEREKKDILKMIVSACVCYLMILSLNFRDMLLSLNLKSMLFALLIVGAVCLVVLRYGKLHCLTGEWCRSKRKEVMITVAVLLVYLCSFYDTWIDSSKIAALASLIHLPAAVLLLVAGVALAAVSSPFLLSAICLLGRKEERRNTIPMQNWKGIVVCAATAIGVITVCSKSSFLYPLNDWVDANCFFTVGKSMMKGVVVYRDLWEQKGPFLYFLHALASLISDNSFFGVYLLELVAAFFFLYFSFLSLRLFVKDSFALISIPVAAAVIYTSLTFCHGDSAEELCLPFLAFTLFVSLRAFCKGEEISFREFLLVGIGAGLVFWTKYTMVGFYLGWYLVPAVLMLQKKQWKSLWKSIEAVAAGVLLSTIPFVVYFGVNNAIGDWFKVYIFDNIFLYTLNESEDASMGLINNLISGFKFACDGGFSIMFFSLLGSICLAISEERKISVHFFLTLLLTFFVTFMGGRQYDYYAFVMAVFAPFGVAGMVLLFAQNGKVLQYAVDRRGMGYILVVLSVLFSMTVTPNRYLRGVEKNAMPQYQFRQIIEKTENPTLLNFGFLDGGFYTACEIVPNCKAFAKLNIPLAEMDEMQEKYVREGLCDFVVTRELQLNYDHYECVAQSQFRNKKGTVYTYYLYQLR